jgi:HK97 family phage major capsid protein
MKLWIKFLNKTKAHAEGEIVQMDEAGAQSLIDAGIAEKTEAPEEVKGIDAEFKGLIDSAATAAATAAVAEIRKSIPSTRPNVGYELGTSAKFVLPATVKRYGSLKNFKGEGAEERAYRFGLWGVANYLKNTRRIDPEQEEYLLSFIPKRCKEMGIGLKWVPVAEDSEGTAFKGILGSREGVVGKAANEALNTSSAFTVPDEFQNDMIDLREKYGVFRQNAKTVPMASDTRSDPRRKGGVISYFIGEDQPGTQSVPTKDRVRLTAKKLMVLSKMSNEVREDSILNLGDDLAGEIAYSFAHTEDQCGFIGDGSSTYGGIVGATNALTNLGTIANVLGLQVASGSGYASSYGSIVLSDFNGVIGRLPEYADDNNAKWYVHRSFWGTVMQKLLMAGGGNKVSDLQGGAREKTFAGYPVVCTQVMPKTPAVNQVVALFGDLERAASFGDRRMMTVALSDIALNSFEQDEIAIRGTERFDINVHDVGEVTGATARDPVMGLTAGPIVGLITAAS